MDLPSKLLEQIASIHELKLEEHTLIVMDKSTHEDHLSQPLQTNNKQFEIAVTILSGYKGIIKVTNKNIKFRFASSNSQDVFYKITIPPGASELESLNKEIKRIIIQ